MEKKTPYYYFTNNYFMVFVLQWIMNLVSVFVFFSSLCWQREETIYY